MIQPGLSVKVAATYSPTWYRSTIGASELNFSVRDGKRWILAAITALFVQRKNFTPSAAMALRENSRYSCTRSCFRYSKLSGY